MKETIKYISVRDKELPINVLMTGVSICDENHNCVRKNPDITIIEYVFKGEGTILINNKEIDVKADDIYILPAGISHEYYANPKNPWAKYFMNLSGSLAQSLLVNFSLNNQVVFSAPSLKNLFKEIMKVSFSNIPEVEKQSKLTSLYFEILHRLYAVNKDAKKNSEAVLLKNYLEENSNRIVPNKELAKQIYRSSDYCLKLFKREFGTTPYEYQMNNKIIIASSFLQHTKMSISEIAEYIGYQNPHYFTSMFKLRVGVTPTQYRKKFK